MVNPTHAERFGDWDQYEKLRSDLYGICARVLAFPQKNENERHFLLAAIRRTLSLEKAFVQSVESNNGQMAMTLVRLNLDTLARFYTCIGQSRQRECRQNRLQRISRGEKY
jgi:IS1 family transposase